MKKNIHLLPTDKPSRLLKTMPKGNLILSKSITSGSHWKNQNIYITSDDVIKEEYWALNVGNNEVIYITKIIGKLVYHKPDRGCVRLSDCRKIILTADQDLINDGVQNIPNEFLEWFVKNPSCEEVKIEEDKHLFCKHCNILHSTHGDGINCDVCRKESQPYLKTLGYKIIIPKEEPKQETHGVIKEILKVCANGDIYVKGELMKLDKEATPTPIDWQNLYAEYLLDIAQGVLPTLSFKDNLNIFNWFKNKLK